MFTYNCKEVKLSELVKLLKHLEEKFPGLKVYSEGKTLVEDFGIFRRIYRKGNWGDGLGTTISKYLKNIENK